MSRASVQEHPLKSRLGQRERPVDVRPLVCDHSEATRRDNIGSPDSDPEVHGPRKTGEAALTASANEGR